MLMIAFEIHLNDQKLCRAGVGDSGVLSAIVTWAAATMSTGTMNRSLFVNVGGLVNPEGKHVSWINQRPLAVGDKIQVNIVEADSLDEPQARDRADDERLLQARESQVRRMAKELGWRIVPPRKKSAARSRKKR